MPGQRPGRREVVTATKDVLHGAPATESGMTGIAAKIGQAPPMAPNSANALIAQTIDSSADEDFILFLDGTNDVLVSLLPAGADVFDAVYIKISDNSLVDGAEALTDGALEPEYLKFGRIVEIDTLSGRARVNLNVKAELPG